MAHSFVVCLCISAAALAVGCATPNPAQPPGPPASDAVRVTSGSRLPQPPDPATQSVTGEDLERTGHTDPAAALRELLPIVH